MLFVLYSIDRYLMSVEGSKTFTVLILCSAKTGQNSPFGRQENNIFLLTTAFFFKRNAIPWKMSMEMLGCFVYLGCGLYFCVLVILLQKTA